MPHINLELSSSASANGCDRCANAFIAGARFCPFCGNPANAPEPPPDLSASTTRSDPAVGPVENDENRALTTPTEQDAPAAQLQEPATDHLHALKADRSPAPPDAAHNSDHRAAPDDTHNCPLCGSQPPGKIHVGLRITAVHPKSGESVLLGSDKPVIIGNDEECDLMVSSDQFVSRRHARISIADNLVFVDDLGSSNGTLLRIRRPIVVEPGDELIVGSTVLRLECV